MIDTIRLGLDGVEVSGDSLIKNKWTRAMFEDDAGEGQRHQRETYTLLRKSSPHYLQYAPKSGRLKVETSLPKMLYSENVTLLKSSDVPVAQNVLSEMVSSLVGKPVDMGDAEIQGRVDFVFGFDTNWHGKSHVADYLTALSQLELARHYSQNVARSATLYWRNSNRVIRLYDKAHESGEARARGNLRFEIQANHAKKELSEYGFHSLKLKDVATWDVAKTVLGDYLSRMGADLVVSDERVLAQTLIERVGPARARRLMGYIALVRLFGRDGLVERGFDRKMPWRDAREFQKIDLSPSAIESGLLPPLRLPEVYDGQPLKLGGGV